MEYLGYAVAILMGFLLGILGGGGSILTVPILIYFFDQDALTATTNSLFVVGIIAFVGASYGARKGLIDFKHALTFAIPSTAGVFFARRVLLPVTPSIIQVSEAVVITKNMLILISFTVLMLSAAAAMIRSSELYGSTVNSRKGIALKGFLVGAVTGFVGAAGGFLITPALVLLLHLPMKKAVATTLAIVTANSLFGFLISSPENAIDWQLLLVITLLGSIGMWAGQRSALRFSDEKLKKVFGYFVFLVGALMLIDQLT